MTVGVLIAVAGKLEPQLVRALTAHRTEVSVVRRCADAQELLSAAAAGIGGIAVLDASRGDIDAQGLAELTRHDVATVLLAHPDDLERTAALGAAVTLPLDAPAEEIAEHTAALAVTREKAPTSEIPPAPPGPTRRQLRDEEVAAEPERDGRVIVAWGPPGSHGRTTLAIELAHALTAHGSVLLIDADLAAPSITARLGILDDVSGIATLARRANQGRLDADVLAGAVTHQHGIDIVTGIGRPERWREVGTAAIDPILSLARQRYDAIVIDVEAVPWPESDSYDQFAAYPGAVRDALLAAADDVLLVAQADTDAIARLIGHLTTHPITERDHVVITALRDSASGSDAATSVLEVLARFSSVERATLIADDKKNCDAALLAGSPVAAVNARSPLASMARKLAGELTGQAPAEAPSWRNRFRAKSSPRREA